MRMHTASPYAPAHPRGSRWITAALALAGVAYASPIYEAIAGYSLDPNRAFLSELAASGQPHAWFFRTADAASGLCVLIAIGLLIRTGAYRPPASRAARAPHAPHKSDTDHPSRLRRLIAFLVRHIHLILLISLATFAIGTLADAASPLDCAVSLAECKAREMSGQVSGIHQLHSVTSVIAGTGIIAMAISYLLAPSHLATTRLAMTHRAHPTALLRIGQLTAAVLLLAFIAELAGLATGMPMGWWQRGQVLATALLLPCCAAVLIPAQPDPSQCREG